MTALWTKRVWLATALTHVRIPHVPLELPVVPWDIVVSAPVLLASMVIPMFCALQVSRTYVHVYIVGYHIQYRVLLVNN